MKNRFSGISLVYIIIALATLVSFGMAQSRGLRMLNLLSGSLTSNSGPDRSGPDHK